MGIDLTTGPSQAASVAAAVLNQRTLKVRRDVEDDIVSLLPKTLQ
jgi:hypothetical protein